MSSERKLKSSQANGALSHGPVTPEGKARSSQNALRHGMFSRCVIVGGESADNLKELVEEHQEHLGAASALELGMIEEMASAMWRMRRLWAIEQEWMTQGLENQEAEMEITRIANTFGSLADTPKYRALQRYENRMHRLYQRSLKTLMTLQARKKRASKSDATN